MLKAEFTQHILNFIIPGGTSRGVLHEKPTWILKVWNTDDVNTVGYGECSPLKGLSIDNLDNYEDKLNWLCQSINNNPDELYKELIYFPSIQFGLETALLDLQRGGNQQLFKNLFIQGNQPITINGLIWMGEKSFMQKQVREKLDNGFACVKMKIGAIHFEDEINILKSIRNEFNEEELELRVDANGAFTPSEAMNKLNRLAELDIHSIEQPIATNQWQEMAKLCEETPVPIALDEELIGKLTFEQKTEVLETISPQYIILKPSLIGGFKGTQEWIQAAGEQSIPWWITSALESNIGLNAIAQFTANTYNPLPQGLGTGKLYDNNFDSPLTLKGDQLWFDPEKTFDFSLLYAN